MVSATTSEKDPVKARAGLIGARRRWGEPRILRLDALTTSQRTLVLALIAAAKSIAPNEKAPAATTASAQEVSSASSTTPTS